MSALDSKKTFKALCSKGFVESEHKSKDHKRIEFWYNGTLTRCRTKFSHNNQELNDYLIREMSKQTYLTKKQFTDFAKCTISELEYIEILK
ncbi:MAG: hypothetical protein WC150_09040, partial [Bacteroidia bacterium]